MCVSVWVCVCLRERGGDFWKNGVKTKLRKLPHTHRHWRHDNVRFTRKVFFPFGLHIFARHLLEKKLFFASEVLFVLYLLFTFIVSIILYLCIRLSFYSRVLFSLCNAKMQKSNKNVGKCEFTFFFTWDEILLFLLSRLDFENSNCCRSSLHFGLSLSRTLSLSLSRTLYLSLSLSLFLLYTISDSC